MIWTFSTSFEWFWTSEQLRIGIWIRWSRREENIRSLVFLCFGGFFSPGLSRSLPLSRSATMLIFHWFYAVLGFWALLVSPAFSRIYVLDFRQKSWFSIGFHRICNFVPVRVFLSPTWKCLAVDVLCFACSVSRSAFSHCYLELCFIKFKYGTL